MLLGVLAGLTAGALWGLTFVAPLAVQPFTILDITVARYAVFGLTSLLLMAVSVRFRPWRSGMKLITMLEGLLIGALGYVAYFLTAAYAVVYAGPAIPPLVIGLLPVLLAVIGNWRERGVPWGRLALPLGLIFGGTLVVNVQTFVDSPDSLPPDTVLLGCVLALAALGIWILYAIINSRVMRATVPPDPLAWTGLQGLGAGLSSLPLIPLTGFVTGFPAPLTSMAGLNFIAWALILALLGAWVATWCWVIASHRLSLALSAQLIVTESVFGLFYGFAWVGRWPTAAEAIGAVLQMVGVIVAVRIFASLHIPHAPSDPDMPEEIALTGSPR